MNNLSNYVHDPRTKLARDGPKIILHKHYVNGIVNFSNDVNDPGAKLSRYGLEIILHKHYVNLSNYINDPEPK